MILNTFQWLNRLKNTNFKKIFTLTEKIVRNDEKMIDPDYVQDNSGEVSEGKGDLKFMILDVFQ